MSQFNPECPSPAAAGLDVDIAILGAGPAGCAAAAALGRQGRSVVLIDLHARAADEFRAEKMGMRQIDYLRSFGLEAALPQLTGFAGVWVHSHGRLIGRYDKPEFGTSYGGFVNSLRDSLPKGVTMLLGRVDGIETGERQVLALADGRRISARLLVLATGLIDVARRKLGFEKQVISAEHSLTLGFDLARPAADFPFPSLVWYLDRFSERGAYLTLFPIGERMRANLFTYRRMSDPWIKAFRTDPATMLHRLFPELERHYGRMAIAGTVAARPVDLMQVREPARAGVVLIGDAFFTSCPTTGTGLDKAFSDVDILAGLVPEWLATPGMGRDKIERFYAHPAKQAHDALVLRSSRNDRARHMGEGFSGRARWLKNLIEVRGGHEWRELAQVLRRSPAGT